MPRSTIAVNCSSWPGRPSCALSVHAAAPKLKSSYCAPGPAAGLPSGSTKVPCCPVLLPRGAGRKCGAGLAALSAAEPRRSCIARLGTSTMACSRISGSIASITLR
ncbi:hypothetical protein G6F55_014564 [Rhizopus delemar]|nr:hypothetical protein G6F55_014564 [Rhizopus delemar]